MADLNRELWGACRRADVAGITRLLAAGAEAESKTGRGLTPIHHLMRSGAHAEKILDCLEILLAAKAQVATGEWGGHGETPLISICRRNSESKTAAVVELLVKAASPLIDSLDERKCTALATVCDRAPSWSWSKYDARVVKMLLAYSANPNMGYPLPLIRAATSGNWRLSWILLRAGANPTLPDRYNRTALPSIKARHWPKMQAFIEKKYGV